MRPSTDLALVLLALAGVLGLTAAAQWAEPPAVGLHEAASLEGRRVAVEARVLELTHGERATFLVLADDTHRMASFAAPGARLGRGDLVRAVGVVTILDGGPGLSLESLEVIERAGVVWRTPEELAATPEAFDGARISVLGHVRGDDLVANARLRWTGEKPPEPSGYWVATGTFRYHEPRAAYELRVDAWTRP